MQSFLMFLKKNIEIYFSSLLAIISPSVPLVISFFVLTFIDLITGVFKAWKNNQEITSKKMRHSVIKLFEYTCLIIAAYCVCHIVSFLSDVDEKYIQIVLNLIIATFTLIELKSIEENTGVKFVTTLFNFLAKKIDIVAQVIGEKETKQDQDNKPSE